MDSVEYRAEALGSDSKSMLLPYHPRSSEGRTLHGEQPVLSTLVYSSVPSATLTTLTHSGTYGWWFASVVWLAFPVDEAIQGRTSTKIKDFFHLPLHLSI